MFVGLREDGVVSVKDGVPLALYWSQHTHIHIKGKQALTLTGQQSEITHTHTHTHSCFTVRTKRTCSFT